MGIEGGSSSSGGGGGGGGGSGGGGGVVTASQLNTEALRDALAAAPHLFVDTYRLRGKQLSFAPDRSAPGSKGGAAREASASHWQIKT